MTQMPTSRKRIRLGLLALGLGLGSAAQAQFGGSSGRRQRPQDGSAQDSPRRREDTPPAMARANQATQRLSDLRFQLMITAEQAPTWDAFSGKANAWIAEIFKPHDPAPGITGLQFMQSRLTEVSNRYTLMENLVDATKALYQVLTPDQQRVADHYLPGAVPL